MDACDQSKGLILSCTQISNHFFHNISTERQAFGAQAFSICWELFTPPPKFPTRAVVSIDCWSVAAIGSDDDSFSKFSRQLFPLAELLEMEVPKLVEGRGSRPRKEWCLTNSATAQTIAERANRGLLEYPGDSLDKSRWRQELSAWVVGSESWFTCSILGLIRLWPGIQHTHARCWNESIYCLNCLQNDLSLILWCVAEDWVVECWSSSRSGCRGETNGRRNDSPRTVDCAIRWRSPDGWAIGVTLVILEWVVYIWYSWRSVCKIPLVCFFKSWDGSQSVTSWQKIWYFLSQSLVPEI